MRTRSSAKREARLRSPGGEAEAAAVLEVWRQQALEARRERARRPRAAAGGWRITQKGEGYLAGYGEAQQGGVP